MVDPLPQICLVRHGETSWSASGQHTGLTDLPLTGRGERNAQLVGRRLAGIHFDGVITSPLQRAASTCRLAGFADRALQDRDLVEWNYGRYEGLRTADIHAQCPNWDLFRDGCPAGESAADVAARADRVVARLRAAGGNLLVFSSGHFLRVLAARWLDLPVTFGRCLLMGTASVSLLGYEHSLNQPAIRLWNDSRHVES